jgi:hypothetical protein
MNKLIINNHYIMKEKAILLNGLTRDKKETTAQILKSGFIPAILYGAHLKENVSLKFNKNMTFNIHGIIYTISRVEGNLIHATDNKGNKKMFNAKYLLDDGIKFEKPKRIMSLRKPILSSKQFEDLIKTVILFLDI